MAAEQTFNGPAIHNNSGEGNFKKVEKDTVVSSATSSIFNKNPKSLNPKVQGWEPSDYRNSSK